MNRFKVRYIKGDRETYIYIDAANPVSALNSFHKTLQLKQGVRADEYRITGMALRYTRNPYGLIDDGFMESEFDLPKSANPDLLKKEVHHTPHNQSEAPFMAELDKGRMSHD